MFTPHALRKYIIGEVARTNALSMDDVRWVAKLLDRKDSRLDPPLMLSQLVAESVKYNAEKDSLSPLDDYQRQHTLKTIIEFQKNTQFDQHRVLVGVAQRRRVTQEGQPPPNIGGLIVPQSIRVEATTCYGLDHCEARQYFVDRAIKGNFTHILFVDDDNLVPLKFMSYALKLNLDMVGCNYMKKSPLDESIATEIVPDSIDVWQQQSVSCDDPNDLAPRTVNAMGLGCTLVRVDALQRLSRQYPNQKLFYFTIPEQGGAPLVGEDSNLCRNFLSIGMKPKVIPGFVSPHCSFEESKAAKRPVFYGPDWLVDPKTKSIRPEFEKQYTKFTIDPGSLYTPYDNSDVFGKMSP